MRTLEQILAYSKEMGSSTMLAADEAGLLIAEVESLRALLGNVPRSFLHDIQDTREKIAGWLEDHAKGHERSNEEVAHVLREKARKIREGDYS